MQIDKTLLVRGVMLVVAIAVVWTAFEVMPGRRLAAAQEQLIQAASARNWDKVKELMAEDYRDGWGYDRDQAVKAGSDVLMNFLTLEITEEDASVERRGREATISTRLRLRGRGNALGETIMEHANSFEGHFQFAWSRKSWKPWDWKLVSISQPEIDTTTWTP